MRAIGLSGARQVKTQTRLRTSSHRRFGRMCRGPSWRGMPGVRQSAMMPFAARGGSKRPTRLRRLPGDVGGSSLAVPSNHLHNAQVQPQSSVSQISVRADESCATQDMVTCCPDAGLPGYRCKTQGSLARPSFCSVSSLGCCTS